ncbi:MAG: hypothetical protein C4576_24130 [Desulfobacteraceae bacterium]|nr:MAG: hypothetical protein C4576_24130 [Desulfobacteraceae bacterium]
MKRLGKRGILFMAGCLLGIILGQVYTGFSADSRSRSPIPEGVYVDLTNEFYRALREEGANSRSYTNDMSLTHLREISISTRFMVETNLQLLKNQERIIRLLESGKK